MSGICGWIGEADPELLQHMLGAARYRGDSVDTFVAPGVALGYRWWKGRPGKSPGIFEAPDGARVACAGTLAPAVPSPAADLDARLREDRWDGLDGAFAAARWEPASRTMSFVRDPFGLRSLYYVHWRHAIFFATELKQLLTIPDLPVEVDHAVLHKYLCFSFVPGESLPIAGIKRLPPGQILRFDGLHPTHRTWFTLREEHDPALEEQAEAVRLVQRLGRKAVRKRLNGEDQVGLYLSGGIDSSAVGVWLKEEGAKVTAFTLDFGASSVEREQASQVASHLGFPLQRVAVTGADVRAVFDELVHRLDVPFGDAVTGPHYLLGRAARQHGLSAVFNGEGGDQLFGGWTSKPMVAAALYGGMDEDESPEELYLRAFHRFYGLENQLYTEAFRQKVGGPGQRRAVLQPYLHADQFQSFLNRVRLTDMALKGSYNILSRAERMANAWALDVRVPLFDRTLAVASFRIPPRLKLHGASEKYVLKLAMQGRLPEEIIWRRKFGMSVPITDWLLGPVGSPNVGPLWPVVEQVISERTIKARGLFRWEYVQQLLAGRSEPGDTRRRRIGERLWALVMIEAWMRTFIDRRGVV